MPKLIGWTRASVVGQGLSYGCPLPLSDIEYEALLDISLGLTDNLIDQRRYLSRCGVQSRLNSLYIKLGLDLEQFHCEKVGDSFNLRNRALVVSPSCGLINAFEMEREEAEFQQWFARFRRSMGDEN